MAWTPLRPFVVPRAVARLQREIAKPRGAAEWLEFTTRFHESLWAPRRLRKRFSIAPSQIRSEFVAWSEMVSALAPRRLLEIGTSRGGGLFLLARCAAPDAHLIGLDLPPVENGRGIPDWKLRLIQSFAGERQRIDLVRGDSHSASTLSEVERLLGGAKLDVLFIDGDHSYAGVESDYRMYAPLVRPGGLIGIHDIVPDSMTRRGVATENDTGEVYRFWAELRGETPAPELVELVEDPEQDGFGIGVVRVPELQPALR